MSRANAIAVGVTAAALAGGAVSAGAATTVIVRGFDESLELSPLRSSVFVHGPFRCPKGRRALLTLTIKQGKRVARGFYAQKCTGKLGELAATAYLPRGLHFVAGTATACGRVLLRDRRRRATFRGSWCRKGGVKVVESGERPS